MQTARRQLWRGDGATTHLTYYQYLCALEIVKIPAKVAAWRRRLKSSGMLDAFALSYGRWV